MKTEVRMALEAIEEELQKTNVCGYSAKIIRAALAEALKPSHNSDYAKCAEEIMVSLSGRGGIDLFQYDGQIVNEIRDSITNIIAAHFA